MLNFEGMNYKVCGAGRPILLLHGWGANSTSFAQIIAEFSLNFKVFALDLWGFGGSDLPPKDATIYDYAEAVYRFIEGIIGEKTAVLGHSFGGRICLILGNRPLISGVVLVDSAGLKNRLSLWQKAKIRRYKKLREKVNSGQARESKLERFGSADYRNLSHEMRGVFVRVVNCDLIEFARNLETPTMVVWGRQDRTTPIWMAKKLHKLIKNSQLKIIRGGHFCYLDSAREFVNFCDDFLNNLEERDV